MKVKKVFEVMVRSVVTCAGGEGFRDAVVCHFFWRGNFSWELYLWTKKKEKEKKKKKNKYAGLKFSGTMPDLIHRAVLHSYSNKFISVIALIVAYVNTQFILLWKLY